MNLLVMKREKDMFVEKRGRRVAVFALWLNIRVYIFAASASDYI